MCVCKSFGGISVTNTLCLVYILMNRTFNIIKFAGFGVRMGSGSPGMVTTSVSSPRTFP